jgi:hypothetical protein
VYSWTKSTTTTFLLRRFSEVVGVLSVLKVGALTYEAGV